MKHHGTALPVTVEEINGALCVRLHNWGDKDWLEDRLTEDFEVGEIGLREEKNDDGSEVFWLIFLDAQDKAALQAILDRIE